MATFNGQALFDSGPRRFHVGGLSLRHALQTTPGGEGVRLTPQGRSGRAITQTGDLLADDSTALQSQTAGIESLLDGCPHELVDDQGRTFAHVVMLSLEPEPLRRVGTRWAVAYRIQYLQLIG